MAVKSRNPYKILGVDFYATIEEITRAYRRLAQKHHPDKNPGDDKAAERFRKVGEAYALLSNDKARAEYDSTGEWIDPQAEINDTNTRIVKTISVLVGLTIQRIIHDQENKVMLMSALGIFKHHMKNEIIKTAKERISDAEKGMRIIKTGMELAQKEMKQFKSPKDKENVIVSCMKLQLERMKVCYEDAKTDFEICTKALAIIQEHGYDVDAEFKTAFQAKRLSNGFLHITTS